MSLNVDDGEDVDQIFGSEDEGVEEDEGETEAEDIEQELDEEGETTNQEDN